MQQLAPRPECAPCSTTCDSQPDPIDDFDPTPPDQLTPEQLAAGTSDNIIYGTALGSNGKRFQRVRFGQAEAPPVGGSSTAGP
jgi:hypothetical protein